MICNDCGHDFHVSVDDFIYKEEIICPNCELPQSIQCDYCKWGGLFHCTHPQYYIKDFRLNEVPCEFFAPISIPKLLGQSSKRRDRVHWIYKCSKCKIEKPMDELETYGKGSQFICKECKGK